MYGKMTTSRIGIIGSLRVSNFSLIRLTQPHFPLWPAKSALQAIANRWRPRIVFEPTTTSYRRQYALARKPFCINSSRIGLNWNPKPAAGISGTPPYLESCHSLADRSHNGTEAQHRLPQRTLCQSGRLRSDSVDHRFSPAKKQKPSRRRLGVVQTFRLSA